MYVDAIGERRIWICVIVQAIRDALSAPRALNSQEAMIRAEARRWLRGGHEDFNEVCELAGVDGQALAKWWQNVERTDQHTNLRQVVGDAFAVAAMGKAKPVAHAA